MVGPSAARIDTRYLVQLRALTGGDSPRAGAKAANLGELARAGFPVPEGFVLTTAAFEQFLMGNGLGPDASPEHVAAAPLPPDIAAALCQAAAPFADSALAVRSSAIAEDLPDASFAGQYETVLGVRGSEDLAEAVRRCWASAFAERVVAYQARRGQTWASMAVLVQRLVQADAAGVAFTANPVSGDRGEVVVSAVRGLGERLVSGQTSPDEWVVRGSDAECRSAPEGAIAAHQARAVAELARRVEQHFGGTPQDIEWALSGGTLFLLQARPITALPEHAEWRSPGPGGWARHFRLGEWLGDPVTPLFETWLLPRLDERFWAQNRRLVGPPPRPEPPYAVVNGWLFASMNAWNTGTLRSFWSMVRSPRAFRLAAMMSPKTARRAAEPFVREWREVALPSYRALVRDTEERVDALQLPELIRLVDDLATAAGDYSIWVALVGGTGWKTEVPLARFYREHLAPRIGGSPQRLLVGLSSPASPTLAPHAVHSLDWFHPTLGECGAMPPDAEAAARRNCLQAERQSAEAEARAALAGHPKLLRRFERLLAVAQHFAPLREEVATSFTLGWPLMRRALLRLGADLRERGALDAADDVFFLTRDELLAATATEPAPGLARSAAARRLRWQRQRRLAPPLVLGQIPALAAKWFFPLADAVRSRDVADEQGVRGMPASPGRATGPARIIRGLEDFARLQPGDVLVAPATAPAWTPLFARAAAVVTDTGSVLAHASLVAREFGIPAVVGTGDATGRLRDGQIVTVDGSAGVVELPPSRLAGDAPESIPLAVEPPPGYWRNVADHYPRPLTPLFRAVWLPCLDAGITQIFNEFGLLVERVEHREIGGRLYMRFVPPGGKERPAPPAWLLPVLMPAMARLVPFMRARIAACVEAVRSDKPGRTIQRWYDEWRPGLAARAAELRAVDLSALSDEALAAHFTALRGFLDEALNVHALLGFANLLALGEFAFACRDVLGWDERRALELLSGLSAKSTEPARQLTHLAEMARQRPAVRAILEANDDRALDQLAKADTEFASAFAAYQHQYGCRAIRYEVEDPTLAETPALVLGLIRDQVVRGYDPEAAAEALERQRGAAIAHAWSTLATRPALQRERFARALARAERAYPVREDNEFYTVSQPIALLRYAALELGRRLAARATLATPDDVFFLELDEAWLALWQADRAQDVDWRAVVARRKGERAWADAHPGPASYGPPPGPPPPLGWLPPEARLAMQTLVWATDHVLASEASGREQTAGASLHGIAASPGRYTGPVRVIHGEAEFGKLQPGDVLVCPITSPVWSVLFPSVGALVTDTGGILSHAAIIAREYRVPAVVATGNATRLLRDGQVVTVDGSAGLIEVRP